MLVLRNEEIQKCLTMDTCLEALSDGYRNLMDRQAGYIPLICLHAPCGAPDAYYRWGNEQGADSSKGYAVIRMKSDILSWTRSKTEKKYCVKPGTFCGLIFLFSTRNGEPLAILNDGYIQHMGVGACAGLGAKYLSRSNSTIVGILGSGGMARVYLEAFCKVRPISKVRAYSPTRSHLEAYCDEMSRSLAIPVEPVDTAEKVFKGADIVATCTDSYCPVFDPAWLEPGQHYTDSSYREFGDAPKRCDVIIKLGEFSLNPNADIGAGISFRGHMASVFIGSPEQIEKVPSTEKVDITPYPHLIDLMAGRVSGRTNDRQITFFMNHGTRGVQFVSMAGKAYELARAQGLGAEIPTEWFLQDIRD
ncbi:MAG: ornithine cyclodeaminase family protein [Chloroflexi bacterium]|nr:ornithine cyclodeaminase family protein [Chloroflexota bacterium]